MQQAFVKADDELKPARATKRWRSMPRGPVLSAESLRASVYNGGCIADGSVLFTHSGRSAIHLALKLAGFGPGDHVFIPNYYCPTMVAPVAVVGATPVFYPITEARQPDIVWIEKHVATGKTALLAAHFFGLPIELTAIRKLCNQRGFVLIEDCAHAFFGNSAGIAVGSVGDYAITSLPKFFPVLEGGLLRINTECSLSSEGMRPQNALAELKGLWNILETAVDSGRLFALRPLIWFASKLQQLIRGSAAPTPVEDVHSNAVDLVAPSKVREESLSDPLLAIKRLRSVEQQIVKHSHQLRNVELRRKNYLLMRDLVGSGEGFRALAPQLAAGDVPYVFPIYVVAADKVYPRLRLAGIPAFRWDRYWPGSIDDACDLGRDWSAHVIQMSCHQDLSATDIKSIAETFRRAIAVSSSAAN